MAKPCTIRRRRAEPRVRCSMLFAFGYVFRDSFDLLGDGPRRGEGREAGFPL